MIFLSASVPVEGREYYGTEDIFAIREAIIAFTKVCVEYKIHFYFGGHPAITPLIWQVAIQNINDGMPLIEIYQSIYFGKEIPVEVKDFNHVHFTEAVNDDRGKSIEAMRNIMFKNKTDCAVFIGGMDGVITEYDMLKALYPKAEYLAIASTGGAAQKLYNIIDKKNVLLEDGYAYTSMFRELLKPYKNNYGNE